MRAVYHHFVRRCRRSRRKGLADMFIANFYGAQVHAFDEY